MTIHPLGQMFLIPSRTYTGTRTGTWSITGPLLPAYRPQGWTHAMHKTRPGRTHRKACRE